MSENTEAAEGRRGQRANPLLKLAGADNFPSWAKTILAITLIPPLTLALVIFLFAKFAGLEEQFGMIAEAVSYNISGGPINKQSSEMQTMINIMERQLVATEAMREDNNELKQELLSMVGRTNGRIDGLEKRVGGIETWAIIHGEDPKKQFLK